MYTANERQRQAYADSQVRGQAWQARNARKTFINDFLDFADRVCDESGGRSDKLRKNLILFRLGGDSKASPLPMDGIENYGARVLCHRVVVAKDAYRSNRRNRDKYALGKVMVGAEVEVGLMTSGIFPRLAGGEKVLQVSTMPEVILYRTDESPLEPVEPTTEAWEDMVAFVDLLKNNIVDHRNNRTS